jgi:hypothetical protein
MMSETLRSKLPVWLSRFVIALVIAAAAFCLYGSLTGLPTAPSTTDSVSPAPSWTADGGDRP